MNTHNMFSLQKIPKDIINQILSFLDNKDFYNCLKSSKIFYVKNYNLVCEKDYLERKYKNTTIKYFIEKNNLKEIKFLHNLSLTPSNSINSNHNNLKCNVSDLYYAMREGNLKITKFIFFTLEGPHKEGGKVDNLKNAVFYYYDNNTEDPRDCKICKVCNWINRQIIKEPKSQ